jgi:hypothetical protein
MNCEATTSKREQPGGSIFATIPINVLPTPFVLTPTYTVSIILASLTTYRIAERY